MDTLDPRPESLAEELRRKNLELEAMTKQLETMVDHRTRQIERAKKEWERTFDAISEPLTVVGSDFQLRRVNLAAARQAGKDVRQMPGTTCYGSMFGRDEPCDGCPLVQGSGKWTHMGSAEGQIVDSRGGKSYALSVFLLETETDKAYYICFYKDETEKRNLQRQIMQSEKMAGIGQLAGGVAHELNNPIGVILSFTQFSKAIASDMSNDELTDNLIEVENAALRCKKIVSGLLDFSRPSKEEEHKPVSLGETLESALFLVSTQSAARSLSIVKEFAPALPMVLGNANQLLQVFINLIGNAVQAMPGGGTLTLRSGTAGGKVFASVVDTGTGIPPENLDRIFEPFFTTKAPGKGTGLGLSVTYGIVERHSGRIEVKSELGKGSEFIVLLPPAPTEAD